MSSETGNFKTNFYQEGADFLTVLLESVAKKQVPLRKNWDIDHLCYRAASLDSYQEICRQISLFAELLTESDVNGRPIATYKLAEPFRVEGYFIDVVEVPAPKDLAHYQDGFEHIEIVIDIPLDELKRELRENSISFAVSPKALNTEVKISLDAGSVKFHQLSLESLIRLETSKAYPALLRSKVLETLTEFTPLVTGTFPLGLEVEDSDLDIVVGLTDGDRLEGVLAAAFSKQPEFRVERHPGELFCRFRFEGIPIEVFAEPVSERRRAYHHFLIEERILKIAGTNFRQRLIELRRGGLKTEPAFATALGLHGDPYESLLALQTLSLSELSTLIKI
jgi:predicted metalloenzyme YecM